MACSAPEAGMPQAAGPLIHPFADLVPSGLALTLQGLVTIPRRNQTHPHRLAIILTVGRGSIIWGKFQIARGAYSSLTSMASYISSKMLTREPTWTSVSNFPVIF